jgi:hypothetical protein
LTAPISLTTQNHDGIAVGYTPRTVLNPTSGRRSPGARLFWGASGHGLTVEIAAQRSMLSHHLQGGVAMRWFYRNKPKEIWDENIKWDGDIEAAHKIRDICNSAAGSAEKVGHQGDAAETKANKHEAERYKRAAKIAMEIAIKISDDLLRDTAVCQIVVLCLKANDLRTALILFRAVQAVSIRNDMLNEHPALRQAVA